MGLLDTVADKGAQLNPESLRCFVVGQATEDKGGTRTLNAKDKSNYYNYANVIF